MSSDESYRDDEKSATSSPVREDRTNCRMERQKVVEFLQENKKFRRQIERLEKEQALKSLCRKHGWTDVCEELEEYEKMLDNKRKAQKVTLQKQQAGIQNGVKKFQRLLTDVRLTPEVMKKLNEILSEMEMSIKSMKEEQNSCLVENLKEQRTCRQELSAFEKKMETWKIPVSSLPQPPVISIVKASFQDRNLPAEVRTLEDFLQKTGGLYGGWDQFDHQVFLKVWMKHRQKLSYRKEAMLFLPGKALEDLEQHEDWYGKLLILKERKRQAIDQWKANKHRERQIKLLSQKKTERERERTAQNMTELKRTEEEKLEVAHRLEEWRNEKKRREEEAAKQRKNEETKKRILEMEKTRQQLEVKKTIEESCQLRREQEEEQGRRRRREEEQREEQKQREATRRIKSFRERDLFKVEARLHKKQLRENEEKERRRRVSAHLKHKVEAHVARDPSRLGSLTVAWQERLKQPGPSGGGLVVQAFHRAVPTWRQGL